MTHPVWDDQASWLFILLFFKFHSECKRIENYLNKKKDELIGLCDAYKNSIDVPLDSLVIELKQFYENFIKCEPDIDNVLKKCKTVTPFKMRRQTLAYPNNKCLCAISYHTDKVVLRLLRGQFRFFNGSFGERFQSAKANVAQSTTTANTSSGKSPMRVIRRISCRAYACFCSQSTSIVSNMPKSMRFKLILRFDFVDFYFFAVGIEDSNGNIRTHGIWSKTVWSNTARKR